MKIGIIGLGNMGGAILTKIAQDKSVSISAFDCNAKAFEKFPGQENVRFCNTAGEAIDGTEFFILCVKPYNLKDILPEIAEKIKSAGDNAPVPVSIAAGVRTDFYSEFLGDGAFVRIMPNLPAMVGAGYSGIYFSKMDSSGYDNVKNGVIKCFSMLGICKVFDSEEKIDKMIAVTSSSPAYVCLFVEAMADGAVRLGFSRDDAYKMAEQAILGTVKYLLDTGTHPAVLKDMVCSPKGTTIESVAALEKDGFRNAVLDCMQKCDDKASGKI